MRVTTYILSTVLLIVIGCAHSEKNNAEFEGIYGKNKIRVFVQVQADMADPHCEGSKCRQMIVQSARERCTILLLALMQYKNNDKSIIHKRKDIADAIDLPVIKKIKCKEFLCGGIVDFTVNAGILRDIRNTETTSMDDGYVVEKLDVLKDD